jgi:sec-independent protein translocase protein TatA
MRIGPFGIWEILIILVIVLLVFGPKRLPEMAKGLGQSVRAFRKEMRDIKADLDFDDKPTAASPTVTAASSAAPAPAATTAEVPQPVGESRPPRENPSA